MEEEGSIPAKILRVLLVAYAEPFHPQTLPIYLYKLEEEIQILFYKVQYSVKVHLLKFIYVFLL